MHSVSRQVAPPLASMVQPIHLPPDKNKEKQEIVEKVRMAPLAKSQAGSLLVLINHNIKPRLDNKAKKEDDKQFFDNLCKDDARYLPLATLQLLEDIIKISPNEKPRKWFGNTNYSEELLKIIEILKDKIKMIDKLFDAVWKNNPQEVKQVITQRAQNNIELSSQDEQGSSPLHVAAYWGYKEIASDLIASLSETERNVRNHKGYTALQLAVLEKREEIYNLILSIEKPPSEREQTLKKMQRKLGEPALPFVPVRDNFPWYSPGYSSRLSSESSSSSPDLICGGYPMRFLGGPF